MRRFRLFRPGALFSVLATTLLMVSACTPSSKKAEYLFKLEKAPHSADPVLYDYFTHHATFRSVLGGLVSQYRSGGYRGILAAEWSTSDDYREWTFKLRKDLKFGDGTPITAADIIRSWARLATLLKAKNSYSEFFASLPASKKNSLTHLEGVTASTTPEGEVIRVKLEKPLKHLLETVSFGMYSVVSAKDYDPATGAWKDPKKVTSSHAYAIASWDDASLVLKKREDFNLPDFHPRMLPAVKYVWNDGVPLDDLDMIYGPSTVSYPSKFTFLGSIPSYMAYAYCVPYKNKESFCSDATTRKWMKHASLKEIQKRHPNFFPSLFPPSMKGANQATIEDLAPPAQLPKNIIVSARKSVNPLIDQFLDSFTALVKGQGITVTEKPFSYDAFDAMVDSGHEKREFDLFVSYTGILIENPAHDIQFMFKSKEGVRYPDLDGSITRELGRDPISAEAVNQLIWSQNLVWPIGHFSLGTWFADSIDYSLLNSTQPPIELVWIGRR